VSANFRRNHRSLKWGTRPRRLASTHHQLSLGRSRPRGAPSPAYPAPMVAMSEEFRSRWEAERERREVAELEQLARFLMILFGI